VPVAAPPGDVVDVELVVSDAQSTCMALAVQGDDLTAEVHICNTTIKPHWSGWVVWQTR